MTDPAIRVEGLGKRYSLGKRLKPQRTLREALVEGFASSLRSVRGLVRGRSAGDGREDTIWALRDVSFEIRGGEVVGIIGHNGAGKSTLLKILSRITEPTLGFAEVCGRVGSLLEVGTGFHPELSGRENIFLNGAILGMKRVEIVRKFDEIVAFAELERFIDVPVKHYSSGMYTRLAFAVAAHLEPEILLVDEVLAVGDERFQKKCLNKMQDVGQQGRTVLFVSHNMPAVTRLCERTILFHEGGLLRDGPSAEVVSAYVSSGLGTTAMREWPEASRAPGGAVARLRAVRVRTADGRITDAMDVRRPVGIEMEFEVLRPGYVLVPHYDLVNRVGTLVFTTLDQDPAWQRRPRPVGRYVSTAWIPGNFLAEGTLSVHARLFTLDRVFQFSLHDVVAFQVIDTLAGDSARGDFAGPLGGVVRPLLEWTTRFSADEVDTVAAEPAEAARDA